MNNSPNITKFYGITKDSKTNNFMMVMKYAYGGNLRQNLNKCFNSLSWVDRLEFLYNIAGDNTNITV